MINEDGKEWLAGVAEYIYSDGCLDTGKIVEYSNGNSVTDEYSFKCDEKGRVVQIDISCADEISSTTGKVTLRGELSIATETRYFSYGNYYGYTQNDF